MDAPLARLSDILRWADAGVQASLTVAVNPPPHTLDLFAHVVAAEHVWLSRIGRVKPEVVVWPKLSLAQCLELATRNADEFSALVESLDDIGLDSGVTYKNSSGIEITSSVSDFLLHVSLHCEYHL